ncbi:hypothetical protein LINPERHAP2_LOCUS4605 [Linum perenne]
MKVYKKKKTKMQVPYPNRSSNSWNNVCGGGCDFAMALLGYGKLISWGSTDDEGQIYLTSGKHRES